MKPVVVFIASFLIAAAASTGAKVALTKPPEPSASADSAKADSAAAPSSAAENAQPEAGAPRVASADSAARPAGPSKDAHAPKAGAAKPPAAPTAEQLAADSATEAAERRLAKIFTAMDPKVAAEVLEHMTDADAEIILGYVGPRQAAAIMQALPAERVAALSKLSMRPAEPGGKKQ